MNFIKFLLQLGIVATLISCSTQSQDVKRFPLVLNNKGGSEKPKEVFGSMQVTETDLDVGHTFSAFLWPNKPKGNLSDLVEDVTKLSREIDYLTKEYRERNARMIMEKSYWSSWRCVKETDLPTPGTEPQDCLKLMSEATDGAKKACSCLLTNEPLLKELNLNNLLKRKDIGTKIVSMVEDDNEPGNNWMLGGGEDLSTRVGSVLKIRPGKEGKAFDIYIRLKHFGQEGMIYKTNSTGEAEKEGQIVDANFDAEKNLLTFKLLEKVDGVVTGNRFEFSMEKGFVKDGSPDLVRLKGNMIKVSPDGKTISLGGAKFDAQWNPNFN